MANTDTILEIIKSLDLRIKSIVEVGARDCIDTLSFKYNFPNAQITTFECNPEQIPICKKNIYNTDIKLIQKAVSNKIGKLKFNVLNTGDRGSSSLFKHKSIKGKEVTVSVTTLKKELKQAPDLLWLDTQGSELNILKGLGSLIKDVKIVSTEIYRKPAYVKQPTYKDIKKYMNKKGFYVYKFSNFSGDFGDAIFVKKDKVKIPQFITELDAFFLQKVLRKIKKLWL